MHTPEQEARHLLETHGPNALSAAEREYSTAMEMEDLKKQGYWLDIIARIKAARDKHPAQDV